jgi:hypothetical protein
MAGDRIGQIISQNKNSFLLPKNKAQKIIGDHLNHKNHGPSGRLV